MLHNFCDFYISLKYFYSVYLKNNFFQYIILNNTNVTHKRILLQIFELAVLNKIYIRKRKENCRRINLTRIDRRGKLC